MIHCSHHPSLLLLLSDPSLAPSVAPWSTARIVHCSFYFSLMHRSQNPSLLLLQHPSLFLLLPDPPDRNSFFPCPKIWPMFLWFYHSLALKIHLLRYPASPLISTLPSLFSIEPLIVLTTINSTNINVLVTLMEFPFYPLLWSLMVSFTQLPSYFSKI